MKENFNLWILHRQNQIDEGWFDWLRKDKKEEEPEAEKEESPEEIDKTIYKNPLVQKYVGIILKYLGINPGSVIQKMDGDGKDIVIKNWSFLDLNFYMALYRFVAAHVVAGNRDTKSYLRINPYDAVVIINTLEKYHRVGEKQSIADEFGINDVESLSNWIQPHVNVVQNAMRQAGFGQAHTDYLNKRVARLKGIPINNPNVKNLVIAAEDAVKQGGVGTGLKKMHYTRGLYDALVRLNNELIKMGGNAPVEPKKKEPDFTDETGDDDGAYPGHAVGA